MKSREFVRKLLRPAGARLVRKDGDHHLYELPSGGRILVPCGGAHTEAKPYLVRRLRRLLRASQ